MNQEKAIGIAPNIFSQIRQEKQDFLTNYIMVVPGYSFHHYLTLRRINLYLNSKFENVSEDDEQFVGREKLFFNITVPACEVATKMLNVDTKDIRLLPTTPNTQFATMLLEKELKQWLKTSKFGNILNQIAEACPKYGSCVIEKSPQGVEMIDLRRLIIDPTIERIKDSRFVTTIHYMTPSQLKKTSWKDTDVAVDRFGVTYGETAYEDRSGGVNLLRSTPYIKVYKRYGEVPKWWIDGNTKAKDANELVRALFIVAGAEENEKNAEGKNVGEKGVILFKSLWSGEWPFKDFHYTKIMGRWLGLGIPESLFDVQVRMNELKNQKRVSMEISSIHLFQTKDNTIVKNVLTDLRSGDLMKSATGIEPISNEERNLPAFKDEETSYIQQAQRLSFAYDAVTGETSAASTTATAVINAQKQSSSTFGFKRENFTNTLRDYFNDLVMPQLLKDLTPEHIMRFTGSSQELAALDDAAAEIYANDEMKKMALSGKAPNTTIQETLRQHAKDTYKKLGANRFIKIKRAFYSDVEVDFDFNINNEQISPQEIADNTTALIKDYNPQMMSDPVYKLLMFKRAEAMGIPLTELEMASNAQPPQQVQGQNNAPPEKPVPSGMGSKLPAKQPTK